jgi:hypothetical protein
MAFDSKGLDSYIDVAQRIADFRERYPEGSLQPLDPAHPFEVQKIDGIGKDGKPFTATFIIYTAACYRTPHDERPGIGCAWEVYPGRTPYTLGSELMNAETSAWGRAILASLASDSKRGVSSREEVRNRAAEQEEHGPRALADLPRNRDGSVSRSQLTKEELELHGFLTGEKRAEHNALREGADGKLPDDEAAKVRACSPGNPCAEADCPLCTPGAELWTEEQEAIPAAPPLRAPRTPQSLTAQIGTYFTTLGITDRDVRLGLTAQIAGTGRLSSSKELTASQARKVRDVLAQCRDGAALREYLDSNQEVSVSA